MTTADPIGRYVAGWNMAGYLPEVDPEVFDSLKHARAYLVETLDRWMDQDERPEDETAEEIIDSTGDGWYGEFHLWAEPYTEDVK